MSSGGMPELGSKISLISKADIRYEGRLFTVDPQECTIALANVRSFGTEDRETPYPILPQTTVYDYILFRGSDIKDIRVVNNVAIPNDPAIMQMHLPPNQMQPQQQNFPPQSYPGMQPPGGAPPQMNAFGPFGQMQPGNMGQSMGANISQQSQQPAQVPIQQQSQPSGNSHNLAPGSGQSKKSSELSNSKTETTSTTQSTSNRKQSNKSQDSRSGTPINLSRKSPTSDMGVQTNQNQSTNQSSQQQTGGVGNKENQKNQRNHQRNSNNQRERRDSGRNEVQEHKQQGGYRNQNQNHQRSNNHNNNQHHPMNNQQQQQQRGYNNNRNNNNNNNQMRGNQGGSARMRGPPGQNYRPQNNQGAQNLNQNNKPISANGPQQRTGGNKQSTLKFESEFDFEQANNKFEELRVQLAKLKVGSEETKNSDQVNGEVEKKDDSGNETAADHEAENDETGLGYDKSKSFFDNISCEAVERSKGKTQRTDWRQERKLNTETFGVSMNRRGNFRGRGGYYRPNNYHRGPGQYNRGGYRPMHRRNNNNQNNTGGRINSAPTNNAGSQQSQNQQPAPVAAN